MSLIVLLAGCTSTSNEYVAPPPPEVTVATPLNEPVRLFLESTGSLESVDQADVSSRVRGFIQKIEFQPGIEVKQGDVLYLIEKDQYQSARAAADAQLSAADASILVAQGQVATVQAELDRATQDLKRQESLREQNATSIAEYDAAKAAKQGAEATLVSANAQVEAAKADVKQAKAALEKADLDLGYTDVTAPISGMITKTDIKLGNLVENGDALATVVDTSRVFANFTVSDRESLRLHDAQLEDGVEEMGQEKWEKIKVLIRREIDDSFNFEGHIDYVDREGIDPETATLGLRAVFQNPDRSLLPGLFVHIRIPVPREGKAILVPQSAVSKSSRGNYVLHVNSENKVERRDIELGPEIDEWVIVTKGLAEDDAFVVQGLQRAIPGNPVTPKTIELESKSKFIGEPENTPPSRKEAASDSTDDPSEDEATGNSDDENGAEG